MPTPPPGAPLGIVDLDPGMRRCVATLLEGHAPAGGIGRGRPRPRPAHRGAGRAADRLRPPPAHRHDRAAAAWAPRGRCAGVDYVLDEVERFGSSARFVIACGRLVAEGDFTPSGPHGRPSHRIRVRTDEPRTLATGWPRAPRWGPPRRRVGDRGHRRRRRSAGRSPSVARTSGARPRRWPCSTTSPSPCSGTWWGPVTARRRPRARSFSVFPAIYPCLLTTQVTRHAWRRPGGLGPPPSSSAGPSASPTLSTRCRPAPSSHERVRARSRSPSPPWCSRAALRRPHRRQYARLPVAATGAAGHGRLAAFAAALAVTLPLVVVPLVVAAALTGGGADPWRAPPAAALGSVAYAGLAVHRPRPAGAACPSCGAALHLHLGGFVARGGDNAARLAVRSVTATMLQACRAPTCAWPCWRPPRRTSRRPFLRGVLALPTPAVMHRQDVA